VGYIFQDVANRFAAGPFLFRNALRRSPILKTCIGAVRPSTSLRMRATVMAH
jgi:hypothetical protein